MSTPLIFFNKSTDIVNNRIPNRTTVDSYIFLYDTQVWKIVGEDLTLSTTTNPNVDDNPPEPGVGVDVNIISALPLGNNKIGKVCIDQTTNGTTNKVVVTQETHDHLNGNMNLQINDVDVSSGNPVQITIEDGKNISLGSTSDVSKIDILQAGTAINWLKGIIEKLSGTLTVRQDEGSNLHITIDSGTLTAITNVVSVDASGTTVPVSNVLHDDFNTNANIQIGGVDADNNNPVPISGEVSIVKDDANTARTVATKVLPIQCIDATGKVSPAGDVYTNAQFVSGQFVDNYGVPYGVKHVNNKPRVSSMSYLYDIAEGNVVNHETWGKIGYSTVSGTTTKDIWSYTDTTINIPTTSTAMEVYTNNAQDLGTVIRGPFTAEPASTLTSLVDTSENFTSATAVDVGDLVVLDKAGTTPEYGYVTAVSATTLTISGGFSSGGSPAGRSYHIIDTSATTGVHIVIIKYLTILFAEKSEIVICGGNATGVNLVNTDVYRINLFRVISTGSAGVAVGALQIQDADGTAPIYSYIAAGYSRARNTLYTVPASKILYIVQFIGGYATSTNNVNNARIILKARQDNMFRTNTFQVVGELLCVNNSIPVEILVPHKIVSGVDIKCTAVPTANGQVTTVLRGWLESE